MNKSPSQDSQEHLMTVATFDRPEAAEAFRRHLVAKALTAEVLDERSAQKYWFLAARKSGLHVQVSPDDAETARSHLAAWESAMPEECRAIHCPACGLSRIEYPHMPRQFILPTLISHACITLGLQRRRHYCLDCHEAWVRRSETSAQRMARLSGQPHAR